MSRDGQAFVFSGGSTSYITDIDRSFVWEFKVGGISPEDRLTLHGQPATKKMKRRGRELAVPLLPQGAGNHPLHLERSAYLESIRVTH